MSFNGYKDKVEEGDIVILFLTINQIYSIKADLKIKSKKGILVDNVFQTPYGALKCSDLIGVQYGSKISLSQGWGYIMQPTPELWTLTLPHRTQIIYTADISMIILQLDLSPGKIVIESGTGSGSLSHALIRTIKPHGHLFTYDFHESRIKLAQDEFVEHGLSDYVTIQQRDVCSDGFNCVNKADAIFLDLPHPWQAIPHTMTAFKETGGRICSFSPCIEQVQKSCCVLNELGFQNIDTMEILQSSFSIQTKNVNVFNLDFLKTVKDGTEEKNKERETVKCITAVSPSTMPGHTGYLTFATFPPLHARNVQICLNKELNE